MKRVLLIIGLVVYTILIHAQTDEESRIKKAALDYADGFYSGDYERIGNVLHPELNKVLVYKLPQTGKSFLDYASVSNLIEYTRGNSGFVEQDKRNIQVDVLSITDDIAVARLHSLQFNDFLQLVRSNENEWKILNVLWSANSRTSDTESKDKPDNESEKSAIELVIRDYFTGQFSADPEMINNTIHPEISIAQLSKIELTGRSSIRRSGKSQLVELSRIGYFRKQDSDRAVDIQEIHIMDRMSSVKSNTSFETSYFQLQKIEDGWIIINVLKANL